MVFLRCVVYSQLSDAMGMIPYWKRSARTFIVGQKRSRDGSPRLGCHLPAEIQRAA
jgi:hypothetical protein